MTASSFYLWSRTHMTNISCLRQESYLGKRGDCENRKYICDHKAGTTHIGTRYSTFQAHCLWTYRYFMSRKREKETEFILSQIYVIIDTFTGRWSWSSNLNQEAICSWCWKREDWFPPMACVTLGDWVVNHTGAVPMLAGRWPRKSEPLCFQVCIFCSEFYFLRERVSEIG